MNKYIAYYLRLSLDDGNNIGESNSIASQREIIKEYIYSSDEFVEAQTLEFIDDGYSGTNFNRPGIKSLLEAVKAGEIGCIIVKDLSRFGRQYLEVSKYIEQIFPYIGVRFIAVNDNYDSNSHKGATAEIDVPVRNMINAMYSMDISKKVKSAKQTKIKQGIVASAHTIYGYRKDNVDKGQILVDEPAAAVVRKIFQLALDGNNAFKIAEKLNNEQVPTPSAHKNNTVSNRNWNKINKGKNLWTSATIFRILKDERYTGTFIGGMSESEKLGSNENIIKPKEEWIRIPNSHPAVITQEQFDMVAGMIKGNSSSRTKKASSRPLDKKIRCGKCGHKLRYKGSVSYPFYFCDTARYSDEHGCMRGKIRESDLNDAVMASLQMQINLFLDTEKLYRMIENKINKPNTSTENSALQLESEIKNLQANKRKLYESYKNKEISQTIYLQEREMLEKESAIQTAAREALLSEQKNRKDTSEATQKIHNKFLKYQSLTELTKEMADEFIEKISVYETNRIEIRFTFRDELENIMKAVRQNS
ncbi:MAG: recombinase family protein [Oscillospiraceae bacterium]|nr:recombinase family protein [Oscillospiraceae bacterium]